MRCSLRSIEVAKNPQFTGGICASQRCAQVLINENRCMGARARIRQLVCFIESHADIFPNPLLNRPWILDYVSMLFVLYRAMQLTGFEIKLFRMGSNELGRCSAQFFQRAWRSARVTTLQFWNRTSFAEWHFLNDVWSNIRCLDSVFLSWYAINAKFCYNGVHRLRLFNDCATWWIFNTAITKFLEIASFTIFIRVIIKNMQLLLRN